ncbi:hypothetical protein B0H14DRAFT_3098391 [Mycena olivaceomarginata]|nr:hypothetical protein B0H14DRAFT_3098391 [Mycena olivaceomarginata]
MPPSVLIIGASSTVGCPLVQEFLKNQSSFAHITVLSDPAKLSCFTNVQSQGVEVVVSSFLESNSYKGFDTVISLASNAAMKLQPGMIDAAIAGSARHFYPSELGTDISVATREHLRDQAREVPGFAYTLLMTGRFTELAPLSFNNVDVENHTASPYGSPDVLVTLTTMPDIMEFIVQSMLLPLEWGQTCRELRVAGETLTWAALIQTLEEVQGIKYDVTYLDPREAAVKVEAAHVVGDTKTEMLWEVKTTCTMGVAYVRGPFDNALFDFTPENAKQTLQCLYGKK